LTATPPQPRAAAAIWETAMGHANFNRIDRISALFRKELGALVHDAVRDKLVPSVSVSDVEATRDLAYADVFVTAFVPEHGAEAVKLLNEHAWEFRKELARRVDLRTVPELRFKYDDSVDRGSRIDGLLAGSAIPEPVVFDVTRKPAKKAARRRKS
jgi:ribosome-binding factor A